MKDYASIFNSSNDSSALEQKWYLKAETTRGLFIVPLNTDFFYALAGGNIEFAQGFEVSPHRSGRHANNIIKQKKTLSWSLTTFFNIDETVSPGGPTEIDQAVRSLFTSLMGREFVRVSGPDPFDGLEYSAITAPNITFSLFSCVDKFAQQARGCFVSDCEMTFPGDGQAQLSWSGMGKDATTIGMSVSVIDNNAGSTVTVAAGDGRQFKEDGLVMLIEADGFTRSADSPDGTALVVSGIAGDVVSLSDLAGAPVVLADSDGSGVGLPIYLVYYEPAAPAAIDNPIVGLRGSITVGGLTATNCIRNLTISCANNHENVDYCFGQDSLAGPLFIPGDRFMATVELTINMNKEMVSFYRDIEEFVTKSIDLELGENTSRFFKALLPKVQFPLPSIPVPDSGSIPVSFSDGIALQTAQDAADEFQPTFR